MFGKTNWVLKGVRGAHAHAIYVLSESVILGRSANADIQILDRRVSRQHARILVSSDEVLLEDLGSHNGTFVHGLKVVRRALRTGDKVSIGVSEYVIDQLRGRILTSAIFHNKLTSKDTMGATAVKRRMTKEILTSPTLDMPAQRATQDMAAVGMTQRPSEQSADRPPRPAAEERAEAEEAAPPQPSNEPTTASGSVEAEPAYLREQRERAVRLPTPMPGELQWSLHEDEDEDEGSGENEGGGQDTDTAEPKSAPEPAPQRTEPPAETAVARVVPPVTNVEPPTPPQAEPEAADAEPTAEERPLDPLEMTLQTVPLDPRSQRVHTPIPESQAPLSPPAAPAPAAPNQAPGAGDDVGHEAALRTIDAVVRLLKLRAKESGGALLKIQDRENLRKLEGVLRDSHRNKANRRRWTRLPCQFAASIGEEEAETGEARVTDVGAGGLRVISEQDVEPGDLISVRVRLGEGRLARVAVFQTKVIWVNRTENTFGARFHGSVQWELAG